MSAMPYYFCIAALVVVLILRELHHNRIQAGLIDKILEQHGLNAIPREHPLAEIVSNLVENKADETPKLERIRIPIPGMAAFEHMTKQMAAKK